MWDNAPLTPVMTARLKCRLALLARGNSYVKRVLSSVPCSGVKVGGFRIMERYSTVIYLDFVLKNFAIMLLTLTR